MPDILPNQFALDSPSYLCKNVLLSAPPFPANTTLKIGRNYGCTLSSLWVGRGREMGGDNRVQFQSQVIV